MRFANSLIGLLVVLGLACTPRHSPKGPGDEPSQYTKGSVTAPTPRRAPKRAGREILLGEMCPTAAASRPAVKPMVTRRVTWSTQDVSRPVESHAARQFSVLGWDGRRVGVFSVVGATGVADQGTVATGAYAGSSPCQLPGNREPKSMDPTCVAVTSHCGLAVAVLEPSGHGSRPLEEDADPTSFKPAGACVAQGKLMVDIDNDGRPEVFRLADFVGALREPAQDVAAINLIR